MKFSVLLPTRNGGRFLANCISSVLEEPYDDMELVVSDNANTDGTQAVLDFFKGDKRFKVVRLKEPVCVTDNWNRALEASNGDYILMMGDDDCLLPSYFSRMEEIIKKYDNPDCIIYNGYSYIAPHSVSENPKSYYRDPFFDFGPDFAEEGFIPAQKRFAIVRDMFDFRNRVPLNMQTTLMSRAAMNKVRGGAFQPPFPDHYALNSLLLTAKFWVFVPEKIIIVGLSPKSFGHFIYSNKQKEGKKYLGINSDFPGRLPGIELNNCMYTWLSLLKANYPEFLNGVKINRASYVRRQVYSWFIQYKSRTISFTDLLRRSARLSFADWAYLLTIFLDKQSWQRLWLMLGGLKKPKIQNLWQGAMPLEDILNIKEFSVWISRRDKIRGKI